jgi:hypothetical protein
MNHVVRSIVDSNYRKLKEHRKRNVHKVAPVPPEVISTTLKFKPNNVKKVHKKNKRSRSAKKIRNGFGGMKIDAAYSDESDSHNITIHPDVISPVPKHSLTSLFISKAPGGNERQNASQKSHNIFAIEHSDRLSPTSHHSPHITPSEGSINEFAVGDGQDWKTIHKKNIMKKKRIIVLKELEEISSDESEGDSRTAFVRLRARNLIPDPADIASDDDETIDRGLEMILAEKQNIRQERVRRKFVREQSLKSNTVLDMEIEKPSFHIGVVNVSSDESEADNIAAFERLRTRNLIPDPEEVASDDDEAIDRGMEMVLAEKQVIRKERAKRKLGREQSLKTTTVQSFELESPAKSHEDHHGATHLSSERNQDGDVESDVDNVSSDESEADNIAAFERLRTRNLIPDPEEVASDDDEAIDRGMEMVLAEKQVIRKERAKRKNMKKQFNANFTASR